MHNNFYINLGKNIKKKRKELSLTQQDLADKLGISLNFMGKIEVAFSKPSLDTLIKIAQNLDTTVSELSNFEEFELFHECGNSKLNIQTGKHLK